MLSSRLIKSKAMSLPIKEISALLFICSVMTFPRSYLVVKVTLLIIFLLCHAKIKNIIRVNIPILKFYLFIAGIGLFWSIIGFLNEGAVDGIINALRLYVLWSAAFCFIFNLLYRRNFFLIFHKSIVAAGFLISVINFLVWFNFVRQLDLIPDATIKELHAFVGVHEGYIQFTSHNIASLFFVVSYLLTIQFRKDTSHLNGFLVKLSLFMSLALVIFSGRRALWLGISMVPFLIILLSKITDSLNQLRGRKLLMFICVSFIPIMVFLFFIYRQDFTSNSTMLYLQDAFHADDERTIQKGYLIDGFKNNPIFGSGFGAYAGYLRSEDQPWTYELTYHQMLFNLGLIGFILIFLFMAAYFLDAVAFISQRNKNSGIAFSMLVAIIIFAIGAYSNPYFSSFDFLFLLGVLPLISSVLHVKAPEILQ